MSDVCHNCGVVEGRNAGIVTVQVEPGGKLQARQIGKSAHYAGEMESMTALTVTEQVNLNRLKLLLSNK